MTAAKNRGLGKGLEALFGNVELELEAKQPEQGEKGEQKKETDNEGILMLDIHKIKPNPDQPRKVFSEERIQELADSVSTHGIIQPIIVIPSGIGYEIVAGERRWRAAQKAKLREVPCIIRDLTEEERMLFALIENVQRESLNAMEEAEAFQKMADSFGMTQSEIADSVGKSRPYVANAVRLLKLPEEVQKRAVSGELSGGHVRALAAVKDKRQQIRLAELAAAEGWSVRQMEQQAGEQRTAEGRKRPQPRKKNREVIDIEEELKELLGTKVSLEVGPKRGKIAIEYYSREELERLIDLLRALR